MWETILRYIAYAFGAVGGLFVIMCVVVLVWAIIDEDRKK